MVTSDAIRKAIEDDLDLLLTVPDADPPVAKIVDFDKYRYQQEKEAKKQKQRQQELKHIRFSARSAEHDMQTQVKKIEKFLAKGDRVEIILRLRGRERGNKEWAKMRLDTFLKMIETEYKVTAAPKFGGMGMLMQIAPK
jgi:translation initiation factor IF-3